MIGRLIRHIARVGLGCASLAALPALAQMPPQGPSPTHADIAYAPAEPAGTNGHLLDLYLPEARSKPAPVVIFTGGSAWFADSGKMTAGWAAAKLVPAGYAVAGGIDPLEPAGQVSRPAP